VLTEAARFPVAASPEGGEVRRPFGQRIGGQPQALEVALVAVRHVVLVRGAAVQHVVVVDELHLARLQVHIDVEVRVVGQCGGGGNGFPCRRTEPGGVGMTLRGENVLGDEPDEETAGVLGEGRDRIEGRRTVGVFAPRVVGQGLVQGRRQVGPFAHEVVVDRHRVGHTGETAATCGAEAEQADQVGPVGVVVERNSTELVAAHRRIVNRLALVGNVTEDVAVLVLGPGFADMQADAPVQEREIVIVVASGLQGGNAREAPPVQQGVHHRVELGGETVEWEVAACELQWIGTLVLGHSQRGVELGVVGLAQAQCPGVGIGNVAGAPLGRRLQLVQAGSLHAARPARTRRPGRAPVGAPSSYVMDPATTVAR